MQCKFLVLEEAEHSYSGKKGVQKTWRLSLRDQSAGVRCVNQFEMDLTAEQVDAWKGKLRDTSIEVQISNLRAGFNGEFRIEGKILDRPVVDPKK